MSDHLLEGLDLDAIRLFTVIAREGSLQRAAASAGCSRTTIRRKLEELEARVGVPIVHRTRRGIELTEAGEVLATQSEQMLRGLSRVLQTTREVALNPPRPLRFLVPLGLPPIVFDVVFRSIRQLWADAQVHVRSYDVWTPELLGDHDLCFTLGGVVPEGPFDSAPMGDVDVTLFASPEYLARHEDIERPEDLAAHPLLVWAGPEPRALGVLPCKTGPDVPMTPAFVTNDQHVLHEMAARGAGIAYAGHRAFGPDDERRYQRVLPDQIGSTLPVRLLVARGVADSPRVRKLVEVTRSLAGAVG